MDPAGELLRVQPLEPETPVLPFDQEELGPGSEALRLSRFFRDHYAAGAVHRNDGRHEWCIYHYNYIMVSIPLLFLLGEVSGIAKIGSIAIASYGDPLGGQANEGSPF
jgi:hypothetical protein